MQTQTKNLTILLELLKFIQPYKKQVTAALIALIFTASLTLSVGHGVRILIDQGFSQHSTLDLANAIQFILILTLLIAIGTFFRFYLVSSVGERVSADIRLAEYSCCNTFVVHHRWLTQILSLCKSHRFLYRNRCQLNFVGDIAQSEDVRLRSPKLLIDNDSAIFFQSDIDILKANIVDRRLAARCVHHQIHLKWLTLFETDF